MYLLSFSTQRFYMNISWFCFVCVCYDLFFLEDFFNKEMVQTNYAQLVMTWSQQDSAQELSTETGH